jgi:hypothetical protein
MHNLLRRMMTCPTTALPAALTLLWLTMGCAHAMDDAALIAIRDGFEARRDAAFDALRGKPLKVPAIQKPLGPGRGQYARDFSYALINFAFGALWLNEQTTEAAGALRQFADFYLADRGARNDRDSFYWPGDELCRILEFFGHNGSRAPGRVPADVEARLLEMMWVYASENSRVDDRAAVLETYRTWDWGQCEKLGFPPLPASAETAQSGTWDVLESENHHLQKWTALWHFSKLLAAAPEYRDRPYLDGHTAAEHYAAWSAYALEYLAQRARKGLFVEAASNDYNAHSLKGIFNLYDFGDSRLRKRAGDFLDLYFATWAQEQLNCVRGGGKSRIYLTGSSRRGEGEIAAFMYFLLNWGPPRVAAHQLATLATSAYRLPLVVMDLALDPAGRGVYEVRDRCPGLATDGGWRPPGYRLRQDQGGILRYAYCTPEFILGLGETAAHPMADWTMISSQNTWRGVIFAGQRDARIIPQAWPNSGGNTYNQQWGVQREGTQVTCQLPTTMTAGCSGQMRVWFARSSLSNRVDDASGWVFVEAQSAYAAVRPARGGYKWVPSDDNVKDGDWMVLEDSMSPVILEVARKSDFADYAAFQRAIIACPLRWEGPTLTYTGRSGHVFTFTPDTSALPTVDGAPENLGPARVYDSPFVQSQWDSGKITIQKGARHLELDFTGAQ